MFEEIFWHELESWFSSEIACCDECYDDFLSIWPHAYSADNATFQKSSIDLDSFYSGSYLRDTFTKEQFDELIRHILCPRCGASLQANIWPYNFPFTVPDDIERSIQELGKIAKSTPFLLLNHPFAKETFEMLTNISKTIQPTQLKEYLYRARLVGADVKESPTCFQPPPKDRTTEGRYNHAGNPVLYLASDLETCHSEMRMKTCIIAEIQIIKPLTILDLVDSEKSHEDFYNALSSLCYSALTSAKQSSEGWHKPEYVFSRFVADCCRQAKIQAIQYPSTRMTKQSFNLVIIDENFSFLKDACIKSYINKSEVTRK